MFGRAAATVPRPHSQISALLSQSRMPAVGMVRWLRAFLLAVALPAPAGGVNVPVENGVYKLDGTTFETAINKYPAMMVKFYSPDDTKCNALSKIYDKAAKALKKSGKDGPRLAKVDSVAEAELKATYKVKDHCTFLVFKGGNETGTFKGPYGKADIVDYMNSLLLPPGIGDVMQMWLLIRSKMEAFVNLAPGPIRSVVRKGLLHQFALPALCVMMALVSYVCCRPRRSPPPAPPKTKAEAEPKATPSASSGSKPDDAAPADKKAAGLTRRGGSREDSPGAPARKKDS